MLAWILAMASCLHLSVTILCFLERDGWIELVFGVEAFFGQSSYTVFKRIQVGPYLQK